MCIRAGKGNTLVIIQRVVGYHFNAKQILLNGFMQKVKTMLNSAKLIITPKINTKCTSDTTRIPRKYGLFKLHKSNIPEILTWAVMSYINSPTYFFTKMFK